MNLKYCPQCGKETLLWSEGNKWHCPKCDFVLYHNCAAAVAIVISYGDKILLTKRNQNPAKGKLDLRGGFVDPKESAEYACYRELKEELNIEIDIQKLKFIMSLPNVYHYQGIDYNTLDLFFEYRLDEKIPMSLEKNEISEILWLKRESIDIKDIAFSSQQKFLQRFT